jgi:hypothetical protein
MQTNGFVAWSFGDLAKEEVGDTISTNSKKLLLCPYTTE